MPTASTPRPRGRPGGGRERILDVACELISSQGMDDVRVARIARAAGVSTALVHYHFATREALLGEALRHSYARAAAARTSLRAGAGSSAARLLARMIEHCLPVPGRLEREWVLWVELWLRAVRHPGLQDVAHELYARLHDWFSGVIEEGVARGEFRSTTSRRRPMSSSRRSTASACACSRATRRCRWTARGRWSSRSPRARSGRRCVRNASAQSCAARRGGRRAGAGTRA